MSKRTPRLELRRDELVAIGLVLVASAVALVWGLRGGPPLGHDESVYALASRWFAGNTWIPKVSFWADYRAPGLPWLTSLLGVDAPGTVLRGVVSAFALAGVALTWWLGRATLGRVEGVVAAALTATMPLWARASVRFWPDVPGAVLVLAAVTVLVAASARERVTWWAVAAVPLTAAAVVVRFGSPIVVVVAAVGLLWWRRRMLGGSLVPLSVVAVGGGAVVAMILATSLLTGGTSPWEAIGSQPTTGSDLGDVTGPLDFVGDVFDQLASPTGLIVALGVIMAVGRWRVVPSAARYFGFVAGVGFLALGLLVHAEDRYLAPLVPFAALTAAAGLAEGGRRVIADRMKAPIVVSVATLAGITVGAVLATDGLASFERAEASEIQRVLEAHDFEPGCVIATGSTPQVAWYSGCAAVRFGASPVIPDSAGYAIWDEAGKNQPEDFRETLAEWGTVVPDPAEPRYQVRRIELWERAG